MNGILEQEERDVLIPEVALFTEGRPARLLTIIPPNHVIRIPTDPIPVEYAFHIVRYCESSAWIENPALIIQLLSKWGENVIIFKAIGRLTSSAPPVYYTPGTIWDTCQVDVKLPFLNRELTRKAIECFFYPLTVTVNPPGVRVLVVNGPAKSGKSYTYNYILYVNSIYARLNCITVWVDFKKHITSRFGPAELIESLLDQVNPNWENEASLPILDAQQPARWMLELVRLLVSQINSINLLNNVTAKWIIILDRFDDANVPRETIELIKILSAVATGSEFPAESNDVIRLVLLGFQENIPNYRNRIMIDNIKSIEISDIQTYFKKYAAYKGKSLSSAAMDALVNLVQMESMDGVENRTEQIAQKALHIAGEVLK